MINLREHFQHLTFLIKIQAIFSNQCTVLCCCLVGRLGLAIIKLNYWAVKSYKEKYGGIPKMNVTPTPNNDDFELEEISDNEEELDDFNIDYEELTEDEDGQA